MILVVKITFWFIVLIQCLKPKYHLLLLWAIQGSCWMKNSFLGIVEKFGDVLQVFGGALRKKTRHTEMNTELSPTASALHVSCLTSSCPHFNLVTNTAHAGRGAWPSQFLSPSWAFAKLQHSLLRQHTLAADHGFIFKTLFRLLYYPVKLSILASKASEHEFVCL